VRDPRAIIASLLQVGKRGEERGWKTQDYTYNIFAAVEYVHQCLKTGFASSEIAPQRVIEVVYERVVANPEYETKRICEFLKVEWSSRMLHPGKLKHPGERAITNDNVWYDTKSYNRDPEPHEVEKWKGQLSRRQELMIVGNFSGNKDLLRLGIDLANSHYSWTDRMLSGMLATAARGSRLVRTVVALASRCRRKVSQGFRVLSRL
jgi:hypothetical protein